MKTVHELIQEYLNRQRAPHYEELGVRSGSGNGAEYNFKDVTNLKEVWYDNWKFLEFDCKQDGKKKHIRILGHVTREVSLIKE